MERGQVEKMSTLTLDLKVNGLLRQLKAKGALDGSAGVQSEIYPIC